MNMHMSSITVVSQSQHSITDHLSQSQPYHDHIHNIIHHMSQSHRLKSMSVSIIAYTCYSISLKINYHKTYSTIQVKSHISHIARFIPIFHLQQFQSKNKPILDPHYSPTQLGK